MGGPKVVKSQVTPFKTLGNQPCCSIYNAKCEIGMSNTSNSWKHKIYLKAEECSAFDSLKGTFPTARISTLADCMEEVKCCNEDETKRGIENLNIFR